MTIGYIGLGKMGKNMVLRLLEQGVDVVAWNRSPEPLAEVVSAGAISANDLTDLVEIVRKRSFDSAQDEKVVIWLMLPAGDVTDEHIDLLLPMLRPHDVLIDGANSFFQDTVRRYKRVEELGIEYMDIGVSGGPLGARHGACLMIGGKRSVSDMLLPLFDAIAAQGSAAYLGESGSGHFAKMVHNGIEYGMMQAIAEGAAVLQQSQVDLVTVFDLYNKNSVISSRLIGWARDALANNPTLEGVSSAIAHSGEGEWTVQTAKKLGIAVPIIEESLNVRKSSSAASDDFRDKMVTALRGQFGGHSTKK